MRILHTADWHIGRTLRGRSRAPEHNAALAEIAQVARAGEVDLAIVAGDVFDASAPTPEAEEIAYRGLLALAETGARVIVIAGNHDHPRRLAAVRPLLDLGHVTVQSTLARPADGGVIEVTTRAGTTARLALLPFLSQRTIINADMLMRADAADHVQNYAERYRGIVSALCADSDDRCVNIIVAHATVVGARMGGGEREAHTIFDYAVPVQVFPPTVHYVALGHIHRAQRVDAASPVWYSGAPMQLDFGEADNQGGVLLIDAEPGIPAKVEHVPIAAGRQLRTLRGSLDALANRGEDVGDAYLRVILEEPTRAGLAEDVRALFANAVDVTVAPVDAADAPDDWSPAAMRRSPADLFAEYLAGRKAQDPAVLELFRNLLEESIAPDAP
jgi:DNA repair protein SbcD/Mre11